MKKITLKQQDQVSDGQFVKGKIKNVKISEDNKKVVGVIFYIGLIENDVTGEYEGLYEEKSFDFGIDQSNETIISAIQSYWDDNYSETDMNLKQNIGLNNSPLF